MSTSWCSAASKLASVLPGSMCAAPLWPTRRGRLGDDSIIAATIAESAQTERSGLRAAWIVSIAAFGPTYGASTVNVRWSTRHGSRERRPLAT